MRDAANICNDKDIKNVFVALVHLAYTGDPAQPAQEMRIKQICMDSIMCCVGLPAQHHAMVTDQQFAGLERQQCMYPWLKAFTLPRLCLADVS